MATKRKMSGWQNRKRKAAKEEAIQRQAGALYGEHSQEEEEDPQPGASTSGASPSKKVIANQQLEVSSSFTLTDDECLKGAAMNMEKHSGPPCALDTFEEEQLSPQSSLASSTSDSLALELSDPAKWPKLTDKIRIILTESGPVQKKGILYPANSSGQKFSDIYYNRKMENGELLPRPWLLYSVSIDHVFCFCCKLFSPTDPSESSSSFISTGYNNWRSVSKALHTHETSPAHTKHSKIWIDFRKDLKNKTTLDSQDQRLYELEKKHWSDVIERLIEIIKFLGSQCLALRGSSDKLFERNNGNFLKLVELFGKFDSVMAEHIGRAIKQESKIHYLSKRIQNEIITLLGKAITEKILSEIKTAKYYSIILDCTPDVSHTEQMTVIIRFVNCKEGNVDIEEHFLGFLEVHDSTGESLSDTVINQLRTWNLNIGDIRGQGYDNGANMRGKRNGLQRLILNMNPRAFCIPCGAHSLNLVVNDAAKVNHETIGFFGTVQELYKFFSSSTKRWAVLMKHVPSLTLKPLSETRWESRIDALQPLRHQIGEIYDALYEILSDEKYDNESKYGAHILSTKLKDFQFLCSLILWHDLLNHINPVSKILQSTSENVATALTAIDNLKTFISNYRTDSRYESLLQTARQICHEVEGEPEFKATAQIRRRKTTTQFQYEQEDESPQSPENKFRVNFFFTILDVAMTSLNERFDQLQQHYNQFKLLYNMNKLAETDHEQLQQYCNDLQLHLSDGDKDINGIELYDELCAFKDLFKTELCHFHNPFK